LSGWETDALVRCLRDSQDKVERKKAAKVLGDRALAGPVVLSDEQKRIVHGVVTDYLKSWSAVDPNEFSEANEQIERLWFLAIPALLDNLDSQDPKVASMALNSVVLMRSEAVIREIIERARHAANNRSRARFCVALKYMNAEKHPVVPGRQCLDQKQTQALYDKLIVPALVELRPELRGPEAK
jgi:hypothetical protein